MSDLSWLNPTPHAIAVYASRPLSPVATQHSLPSGRYPLLGPDFHRLDRTSLRLAHSLNHLVGERKQLVRYVKAEHPGRLGIDDEFEFARLHDRQVRGLGALEDESGIDADLTIRIQNVGSVTHQPADFGKVTKISCHGNRMVRRQVGELHAPDVKKGIVADEEGIGSLVHNHREGGFDLADGAGVKNLD